MFGEDAIDFRASVVDPAGKNHAIWARPQALVAGEFAFEGFDVALLPLEGSQGEAEFFSWLGGKAAKEIDRLGGKVDLGHASRAESGWNFVRPFS